MARTANSYRANKPSKSKGRSKAQRLALRQHESAITYIAPQVVTLEVAEVEPVVQIDEAAVVREAKLIARRARDKAVRDAKKAA